MKYTERVFRKEFSDEDPKRAYRMTCEWLAKNVINREDEVGEYEFKITKVKNAENPTYQLTLYASLDEKEVNDQHCKICKETHSIFFCNSHWDCNKCDTNAYRKRMQDKLKIKQEFMKEKIKKNVA